MKSRTLVLCFDGTSNEYDQDNTNIVKLFALLKKDDFREQLCFYQPGIGTYYNPGTVSPLMEWGAKYLDFAIAWCLGDHVMDGYKFLMKNYRVGDKICLFGFSRGAYTARALAGFLYKVGLLPKDNEAMVPMAYKFYKREDKAGLALCAGFKQTYCQEVTVDFVGVWDTVASVGIIMGRTLPFTNSNKAIRVFRHALALDEHRSRFRPSYYYRPSPNAAVEGLDSKYTGKTNAQGSASAASSQGKTQTQSPAEGNGKSSEVTEDVEEVWFAGCHSDVGGGSVSNDTKSSLGNISLRWMIRQVMLSDCDIQFDDLALERADIRRINRKDSSEPDEEEVALDEQDAVQDIHDSLKTTKLWWLLELVPMHYSWQDSKGVWHKQYGIHLGKGRKIPDPQPKFHITVKQRMDSALKYKPKAEWVQGGEAYVT